MKLAFASWSGGKDCSLAVYRAGKNGLKIGCLLNMVSEDGARSRSHGLAAKWIALQAEAMGISILQQTTRDGEYETRFKAAVNTLKRQGITAGVFGDIDFNEHKAWIDRVCGDTGITASLPLWLQDQGALLSEFITAGFEAVVVAARADVMGKEWLGRRIDLDFAADVARLPGVTPCGEAGEYHTLVVDGPNFSKQLEIVKAAPVLREGRWFLDITEARLIEKARH